MSSDYIWLAILAQIALIFVYGLLITKPWQGEEEEAPKFWDEDSDDRRTLYCVNLERHELRHVDLAAQELHLACGEFMRRASIKEANRILPPKSYGVHFGEEETLPRL